MKIKVFRLLTLLGLLVAGQKAQAQDADIPLNHDLYHYVDRLDIKGLTDTTVLTFFKPYGRHYLSALFERTDVNRMGGIESAWHSRMRVLADDQFASQETFQGLWGTFMTNHRDLYHLRKPGFELYLNPVVHFAGGMDFNDYPDAFRNQLPLSINTRGLSIRGSVMNKVGFFSEVTENLTRFPQFVYNQFLETDLLYGEGFVKTFGEESGLDYLGTRAYLTWSPWKFLRIKTGKDRAFWGNGYQSVSLSDHAADYLFVTLTARVWKLEYVSHFTQMIDFLPGKADHMGAFPRKYGVFHQLNYQPTRNLSLGFFESVIYNPIGPLGPRGLELQYFNPIIFFRGIEQYVGSPDNALLGIQAKYNFLERFQLYGQLVLDDFNFGQRDQTGLWQNKFAWQVGAKYIDAFNISTLDLQFEYNRVRPYTYQHFNLSTNFTHYGQALGHPAGANLYDWHALLRYHPFPAWNFQFSWSQLLQGRDENGINYGGQIMQSDVLRAGDTEQFVGQGASWRVGQAYFRASYQLWHTDWYAELEARYRQENDYTTAMVLAGIRTQLLPRPVKQ
jgi:hypothetical protein